MVISLFVAHELIIEPGFPTCTGPWACVICHITATVYDTAICNIPIILRARTARLEPLGIGNPTARIKRRGSRCTSRGKLSLVFRAYSIGIAKGVLGVPFQGHVTERSGSGVMPSKISPGKAS
jgi:hypothetical protein